MLIFPSPSGDLSWHVSRTCEGGTCVMVARQGDAVVFGNSTHPNDPAARYVWAEWNEFLAGAKLGNFDDLS